MSDIFISYARAAQSLARFRSEVPSAALAEEAMKAQIGRTFHSPEHRRLLLDGIARAEGKLPPDTPASA
jgi:hypothetical protein